MHVNDISSELNNVDFDVSLVISGQRWQNCPDTLAFDKSSNSIWNIFFNLNLNPIEPMNLLHFLAVISSPNERKMPDSLSPSQIHILLGDGEAEKKPIRTRWQLFLPQMREKWPMPCPHPRSTFYSGMERPRRNQLGLAGSYFFPKLEKNGRYPVPIPDPHFTRGWRGREETN